MRDRLRRLRQRLAPRAFRLFCVGNGRTGTGSVAAVFEPGYRAAHEPLAAETIHAALDFQEGAADDALRRYLLARDRRLRLEVESSQILNLMLEVLPGLFPAASFVLTVREPMEWLRSQIDHQAHPGSVELRAEWRRWADAVHRPDLFPQGPEDAPLARHIRYSVRGLLHSWTLLNQRALTLVPADRLLILRTEEIGESVGALAAHCGCPAGKLNTVGVHRNPGRGDTGVFDLLDMEHLTLVAEEMCADTLREISERV